MRMFDFTVGCVLFFHFKLCLIPCDFFIDCLFWSFIGFHAVSNWISVLCLVWSFSCLLWIKIKARRGREKKKNEIHWQIWKFIQCLFDRQSLNRIRQMSRLCCCCWSPGSLFFFDFVEMIYIFGLVSHHQAKLANIQIPWLSKWGGE